MPVSTLGLVSTGMSDHVRGSTRGAGKSISVYNQSPRSTQSGHPSVGIRNEYQSKGGDALWLGIKARYGLSVGGR